MRIARMPDRSALRSLAGGRPWPWHQIALAMAVSLSALGLGAGLVMSKVTSEEDIDSLYADPLPTPDGPLRVYHLGHSLVGREMPAKLAALAPRGHAYDSQLGWGTSLKAHWEPTVEIAGFESENDHPRFRPAGDAISSGEYDAVILTEMVEIRDAIAYFQSARYLARWAALARDANPDARVYLYETWHQLDTPDGWLARLDRDLDENWIGRILAPAVADLGAPIHVIPAGQVMAAFVRAVDAGRAGPSVTSRADLFRDDIHLSPMGDYLVALTHHAVLYHRLPEAPRLARTAMPDAQTAALMEEIVWQVVTSHPMTGVPPR